MSTIQSNIDISALYIYILSAAIWFFLGLAFLEGIERLPKKFVKPKNESSCFVKKEIVSLWCQIFCIVLLGYSFWMIACFPANMSPDSSDQWKQAIGEWSLSNWHPAIHTLLIRLSAICIPSPFSMALGQSLVQAAIWSTAGVFLFRSGIPRVIIYTMSLFVAFSPNNGIMTMTIWKDVVFSIAMLGLTISLARISLNSKISLSQCCFLIIGLYFVGLLRHNGIIPTIITAFILVLFYLKKWLIFIPACAIIFILLTQIAIYPIMKVRNSPIHNSVSNFLVARACGAVFYYNGTMDKEIYTILTTNISKEKWINDFNPFSVIPLQWPQVSPPVINAIKPLRFSDKVKIFIQLFVMNPYIVTKEYIDASSAIWTLFQGKDPLAYTDRYCFGIYPDIVSFEQKTGSVHDAAENILRLTSKITIFDSFFWRPGFWILLSLFLAYFSWIKNNSRINLIFIPVFSNHIVLLFTVMTQGYRFSYQIYLIFPFLLLFCIYTVHAKIHNNIP
jgi:hypothetical protein